jgi:hypothetical protein
LRRAARVDENQTEIVDGLRRACIQVEVIGKPLDLLVCHRGETSLMEIKNPNGWRLTKDQVEFIARWPGKIHIVETLDEALKALLGKAMD